MRPVLDVANEREQSLSFQRKAQRRESCTLDAEGKCVALVFIAVKRQERTAVGKRSMQHLRSCDQLVAVNESDQRSFPVKCLERFGNVFRNRDLMSCANQCLRDALEKRGV